jgi:putative tricarboxylic transport membrane protein
MTRFRSLGAVLVSVALLLAACGGGAQTPGAATSTAATSAAPAGSPAAPAGSPAEPTGGEASPGAGDFTPGDVEIVVHSGPGGGNDTLARAMAEILLDEGLADTLYPVSNVEGGSGAAAMAYMAEQAGDPNTWAVHTAVWLTTPMTLGGDAVTVRDLSPIAVLVEERAMLGVRADSPHQTIQDLVEASKSETFIHAGGSVGSLDQVNSILLQDAAGIEWSFLSFEGGGERVAAVLGGNAHLLIEGARDFTELVESGDVRVLAALSPERNPIFPDVPTAGEALGLDIPFVVERRGTIGPPDMPPEAVAYWADLFRQMMETDAWKEYEEESGFVPAYGGPEEHAQGLAEQEETLRGVFETLDLIQ